MDFNPIPFFISFVILTSVYEVIYGEYLKMRRESYNLWVKYVCYKNIPTECDNKKRICARAESLRREICQASDLQFVVGFLAFINVLIYRFYYLDYASITKNNTQNFIILSHWVSVLMIIILVIIFLEALYLYVGINGNYKDFISDIISLQWPFRFHENPEDRLADVWILMKCWEIKDPEYNAKKIPKDFYEKLEKISKKELEG